MKEEEYFVDEELERLGDYAQFGEQFQRHWDFVPDNKREAPPKPVVCPPLHIDDKKGQEFDYLANLISQQLRQPLYQKKNPDWVEPPIYAKGFDFSTTGEDFITYTHPLGPVGVFAPGATANGWWNQNWTPTNPPPYPPTVIFIPPSGGFQAEINYSMIVPDRHIFVMSHFGHMLSDDTDFTRFEWGIEVNRSPRYIMSYPIQTLAFPWLIPFPSPPLRFVSQIGNAAVPTKLPVPIIAKYGDWITIRVRNRAGVSATSNIWWRVAGWLYPAPYLGQGCIPTCEDMWPFCGPIKIKPPPPPPPYPHDPQDSSLRTQEYDADGFDFIA